MTSRVIVDNVPQIRAFLEYISRVAEGKGISRLVAVINERNACMLYTSDSVLSEWNSEHQAPELIKVATKHLNRSKV